jgi:hypothetical protein
MQIDFLFQQSKFSKLLKRRCLHSQFFRRADADANTDIIPIKEMELQIRVFFKVCLAHCPHHFHQFMNEFPSGRVFFGKILSHSETLWNSMVEHIAQLCHLQEDQPLYRHLSNRHLLYDADHFSGDALSALQLHDVLMLAEADFCSLLTVAMYLHDQHNLRDRLAKCCDLILKDAVHSQVSTALCEWMISSFISVDLQANIDSVVPRSEWEHCSKFANLSLETFVRYVHHASVLSQHHTYIDLDEPACLRGIALHYFAEHSAVGDFDRELLVLLKTMTYAFKTIRGLSAVEAILRVLKALGEWSSDAYNICYRLLRTFLNISNAEVALTFAEKAEQFMTLFVCFSWMQKYFVEGDRSVGSTLMLQSSSPSKILKDYLCAMMAIYYVKVLEKRVHILFNDVSSMESAFNTLQSVYRMFNIAPREHEIASKELPALSITTLSTSDQDKYGNEFSAFGVTYCTAKNVEVFYSHSVTIGVERPLENTVLIVPCIEAFKSINDLNTSLQLKDRAPYLFCKYEAINAWSDNLPWKSEFLLRFQTSIFNGETFLRPPTRPLSAPMLAPTIDGFLTQVHLGRRMHRLSEKFYETHPSPITREFASKESFLKHVLNDEAIDDLTLDAAFAELGLGEDIVGSMSLFAHCYPGHDASGGHDEEVDVSTVEQERRMHIATSNSCSSCQSSL